MTRTVDLVIVGGGCAGTAAALAALDLGLSVVITDRSRYSRLRIGETLAPQAEDELRRLRALPALIGHATPCAGIVSAWGSDLLEAQIGIASPYGGGHHVDRVGFDRTLAGIASARGAEVHLGTSAQVERRGRGWTVGAGDHSWAAPFVIDATGRSAAVGRQRGAERLTFDQLIAEVAISSPTQDPERTTLLESDPAGWWYSAPLPGGDLVVTRMTDRDLRDQASSPPVHTVRRIGAGQWSPTRAVNASSSVLWPLSGDGWAAAGDAAATLDPLTGSGMLRALQGGAAVGAAVARALDGDPGAIAAHTQEVVRSFDAYLHTRAAFYSVERRWPTAPFWSRRHAVRAAAA